MSGGRMSEARDTPSSHAVNERCDHPGCLSRATSMYLVGLGGMLAWYCRDHAPPLPPYPKEAEVVGRKLMGRE